MKNVILSAVLSISNILIYTNIENIDKPKVSIITSVFTPLGAENFTEGFLKDITRQTIFTDCELIMINANSPSNEEPIIQKYMRQYPNIIYRKLDHDPGLYGVWNMAIKMAHADYIANANLDDRFNPTWLENFSKNLDENPDVELVYGDSIRTTHPHGTFENHVPFWTSNVPEFSKKAMAGCPPQNQPMWRKTMHDKAGYFDDTFKHIGDWEFWCRAVQNGAVFKKVHGVWGIFYINPVGLSSYRNEAKLTRIQAEENQVREVYQELFNSEE